MPERLHRAWLCPMRCSVEEFFSGAGTNVSETSSSNSAGFPIESMYGIFTYIYHKNQPNVGKYTIHGSYGFGIGIIYPEMIGFAANLMVSFPFVLIMLRWKMMENGWKWLVKQTIPCALGPMLPIYFCIHDCGRALKPISWCWHWYMQAPLAVPMAQTWAL